MEQRWRQEDPQADWRAVERGWCLAERALKEELLAQAHERRGDRYGPELGKAEAAQPERVVQGEMQRRGWTEAELERRR